MTWKDEIQKIDWSPNVKNPFDGTELSELVSGMSREDAIKVREYVDKVQDYFNEIIEKYQEKLKTL